MSLAVRIHAAPRAAHLFVGDRHALADAAAEAREQVAFEAGVVTGRDEAVQSGAAALEAALAALELRTERAEQEVASQAIELAVEIARSLLRVRIDAGDYDLERVVRGALADAGVGRGEVTVHLHPEDHAALQGTTFRTGTHLAVDPNLARGDVHLSTPRGLLVRDVEGSLESIREQLLEELSE